MIVDDGIVQFVSTYADGRDRRQQAPPAAPVEQVDQSLQARLERAKAGLYGDKSAIRAKAAEVRASMEAKGRV